jgi:CheY-like chemotaxis protein
MTARLSAAPNVSTSAPVLVVEDAADIRESIRELLEMDDYTVYTAANGALGLDLLDRTPRPCLVLLDLMMPVMDGFEFLIALNERPDAHLYSVVLVSANQNIEAAASLPNVVGFLRKPFDLDELVSVVESHCRRH